MRKKHYINFLLYGMLTILFAACQGIEKKELLIKKWQKVVSQEEALAQIEIDDEVKKIYNQLSDSLKQKELKGILKRINDNTFEFKEDNTFEFSIEDSPEIAAEGKWALSRDGETLILTKEKGVEERFGVKKLTEKEMIISNKGQEVKFKAL